MKKTTKKTLTLLAAGMASLAAASVRAPSQGTQVLPPSVALSDVDKTDARMNTTLAEASADVSYDLLGREVTLRWVYRASDGSPLMSFQWEAVSYWPTDVAGRGVNTLLVAGKETDTGRALIELWEFKMPASVPAPRVNPVSGALVQPYLQVPIEKRTKLYSDGERGPIRTIFALHGTDDRLLVQFDGQRDVYSLTFGSGALTKVVSVTPEGALPVIPELQQTKNERWSRRYVDEGCVYFLGSVDPTHGDRTLAVFLFDHDCDGTLDESRALGLPEFWDRKLDRGEECLTLY